MVASFPGHGPGYRQRITRRSLPEDAQLSSPVHLQREALPAFIPWLPLVLSLAASWREPCQLHWQDRTEPIWVLGAQDSEAERSPPPPHHAFFFSATAKVSHSLWAPSSYSMPPRDLIPFLPTYLSHVALRPRGHQHNQFAFFSVVNPFLDLFLITVD